MSRMIGAIAGGLHRLGRDERGATAIEYAMIASGICLAIISAVWGLGGNVKGTFYDKLASLF